LTSQIEQKVSIIVNCYNGEKYLRQALNSVLAQTYDNWELIFWDNCSDDHSATIFRSYEDTRFKYFVAGSHTQLGEARNCAIDKARGEFIAFLDVDDEWSRDKLERQIPLFSDLEVGLVCGNYWIKDEIDRKTTIRNKQPTPKGWVFAELLRKSWVGILTVVVRKSAIERFKKNPFDPNYHIISDYDLFIKIAMDWKFQSVDSPVACYRRHASNETHNNRASHIVEWKRWLVAASNDSVIWNCTTFKKRKESIAYMIGMDLWSLGRYLEALQHWWQTPFLIVKARLAVDIICYMARLYFLWAENQIRKTKDD
jgi:glycosyltransferase involved in cell wall biosynthesis